MGFRVCRFCGNELSAGRAREHVFPQWLENHLGIRDKEIMPTHFSSGGEVVSTRAHTVHGLLEGRVCEDCNSGWLSELENSAIPLLVPLIEGSREVVSLEPEERITVARWAAKTSLMLSGASNFIPVVRDDWYTDFRVADGALPEPLMVFGQQHHGERSFNWMQGGPWRFSGLNDEAVGQPDPSRLLRVGLQFGKLLLVTVGVEIAEWKVGIWRGIHVPLWPQKGPIAHYEAKNFPWFDSMRALAAFCVGIQLFRVQSD